jgi:hypothetical protein
MLQEMVFFTIDLRERESKKPKQMGEIPNNKPKNRNNSVANTNKQLEMGQKIYSVI